VAPNPNIKINSKSKSNQFFEYPESIVRHISCDTHYLQMDIRSYEPRDRASCIGIFESLTPELLHSAAMPHFEAWLNRPASAYLVMEHEGSIVGCGGYSFSPDGTAAILHWGMIQRGSHKLGLGRYLLLYRIREIGRKGTAGMVFAHSPRPSAAFFEKQGFRASAIGKDAYAPGIDSVVLTKKLTVCP
jgi:N-acetylglutamate synthase-like GNAT family acetyltransferase